MVTSFMKYELDTVYSDDDLTRKLPRLPGFESNRAATR